MHIEQTRWTGTRGWELARPGKLGETEPIRRSLTTPCPEIKIAAIRIKVRWSLAVGHCMVPGAEWHLMIPVRSRSRQPQRWGL